MKKSKKAKIGIAIAALAASISGVFSNQTAYLEEMDTQDSWNEFLSTEAYLEVRDNIVNSYLSEEFDIFRFRYSNDKRMQLSRAILGEEQKKMGFMTIKGYDSKKQDHFIYVMDEIVKRNPKRFKDKKL